MIKTRSFLSIFLLLILINTTECSVVSGQELQEVSLKTKSRHQLNLNLEAPRVYLPSKLIIGQDNKFIIKGPAGNKVSLAISNTNRGSEPIAGHELRLGQTETTIEGVIPATGILELNYSVPNDETLVDNVKYFEAAIWGNDDFSDLRIAKIIGTSGKETLNNGVAITLPPSKGGSTSFSAMIPGAPMELIRSVDQIKKYQEGKINPELLENGKMPAYLDSPEKRDLILQNINNKR